MRTPSTIAATIGIVVILLLSVVGAAARPHPVQAATAATLRHHRHGGLVTAISGSAITIHAKSSKSAYSFAIDAGTKFLEHGAPISHARIVVGAYVTVSYSPGPHNTNLAWHISLKAK